MSIQVQHRRGNTIQTSAFTGAVGEITVDTDKNTLVVHDGSTPGGRPLAPNTAFDVANAAFGSANNVAPQVAPAYNTANGAYTVANAAFESANTAGSVANNANTYAGSTYVKKSGDTISGDLVVQGNLTISGVTTSVNTSNLYIGDNMLTLNADIPNNVVPVENAGIEINRGSRNSNANLLWIESANAWAFTGNNLNAITTYIASNTYVDLSTANANAFTSAVYTAVNSAFGVINAAFGAANVKVDTITSNSTSRIWANSVTVGSVETVYLDLATSGVTATTYGGATQIPVVVIDAYGRITSASNAAVQGMDYTYANTIWNSANQAGVIANASFGIANAGYTATNSVFAVANAAFARGNTSAQLAFFRVTANATNLNAASNADTLTISSSNNIVIIANATNDGIQITQSPSGVTSGAYSSGISAITVDTYGRVTSVTGSAGYVTSSGVTSITAGSGLTGGTITTTGTVAVDFATVATVTNAAAAFAFANGVATNTTAAFAAANSKVATVAGTSGRVTSSGTTAITLDLATAGAGAASYSSGISAITVDAYGRVTSVTGSAGYITGTYLANTSGTYYNGTLYFPSGNVIVGTTSATTKLFVQGSSAGAATALVDGATITPDFASNNNFTVTIAGNRTMANPSNPTVGQSGIIWVTQDGTGNRTLTWGNYWRFIGNVAPTLSTSASAVDAILYSVRSSTSITCSILNNIG